MRIVKIKKHKVVVGLDWNTLIADVSRTAAIKKMADEHPGVKKAVIVESEGQAVIGLPHPGESISAPSVAAWVSERYRSALSDTRKKGGFGGLLPKKKSEASEQGKSEGASNSGAISTDSPAWIIVENLGPAPSGGVRSSISGNSSATPMIAAGESQYWFCVVQDGLPYPGTDSVMAWDTLLNNLRALLADHDTKFILYSKDSRVIDVFGNSGFDLVERDLDDLLGSSRPHHHVRTISGIPPSVIAVIAAIIVLGLLYYGWTTYSAHVQAEQAAQESALISKKRAIKSAAAEAAYEKQVASIIKTTLLKGVKDVDSDLHMGYPPSLLSGWTAVVGSVPTSTAAWKMDSIVCGVSDVPVSSPEETADLSEILPACLVNLNRGDLGIDSNLIKAIPSAQLNGDQAFYVVKGTPVPARGHNTISNLSGSRSLSLGLLSKLQMLRLAGVSYTISPSQEVATPVSIPPPPANTVNGVVKKAKRDVGKTKAPIVAPIKLGVATGTLTLTGSGIWRLKSLVPLLDSHDLELTSLALKFSGTNGGMAGPTPPKWTLALNYFIRTAPYPVVPSVPEAKYVGGARNPVTGAPVKAGVVAGSFSTKGIQASKGDQVTITPASAASAGTPQPTLEHPDHFVPQGMPQPLPPTLPGDGGH